MKIMIVGGTGFLGYYTALAALRKGHEVGALSIPDVELGDWFPSEIKLSYGDVFKATEDELVPLFEGYDAMVYSVGPDDRVTPPAPSYDFFHERLVEHCAKTFRAAQRAGVKRAVVYNSYFATFDRLYPEKKLAELHPYIRCRVEQAERLFIENKGKMEVMVLELPYIFGSMPGRTPLWKDVYIERFFRAPMVCFPKGGTTMINVRGIGQAGVGALEHGKDGERYPIGDLNTNFKQMIEWMEEGLGIKKPILLCEKHLCAMGANMIAKADAKKGLEPGLNMKHLMLDIMGEELYIPEETIDEVSKLFEYERGGVKEGILDTMKACYPNGFNEKKS
ncbi:MAG TPA: NAD(P)H-binding protein [Clostridia bacterium]|nr:NAD(P)H-binding protein [Clostridia bacterium]